MSTPRKLQASLTPEQDLAKIAYPGQPEHMKMYKTGYEGWFNQLPVLANESFHSELEVVQQVMKGLSSTLKKDVVLMEQNIPGPNEFNRTIIGMEEPTPIIWDNGQSSSKSEFSQYKEGAELVVAKWGDGHTSPIHGHSTGYMHEEILTGKMRVNTYRIVDIENKVVRPLRTEIVEPGVFVTGYVKHDETHQHKRQTLIHNFTSIGNSISLHFLPEHTRDGRDNQFTVEHFSKDGNALSMADVKRIDSREGLYLQPGDVVLVRSTNVQDYGDHFIVVTGGNVKKEHGFRPQEEAIMASYMDSALLDEYAPETGLILLKLNERAQRAFLNFHGITLDTKKVVFPKA